MSDGFVMPSAAVTPEFLPTEMCLFPSNFCFIL